MVKSIIKSTIKDIIKDIIKVFKGSNKGIEASSFGGRLGTYSVYLLVR